MIYTKRLRCRSCKGEQIDNEDTGDLICERCGEIYDRELDMQKYQMLKEAYDNNPAVILFRFIRGKIKK